MGLFLTKLQPHQLEINFQGRAWVGVYQSQAKHQKDIWVFGKVASHSSFPLFLLSFASLYPIYTIHLFSFIYIQKNSWGNPLLTLQNKYLHKKELLRTDHRSVGWVPCGGTCPPGFKSSTWHECSHYIPVDSEAPVVTSWISRFAGSVLQRCS